MSQKRTRRSDQLKFKVALEAHKGAKTVNQIAPELRQRTRIPELEDAAGLTSC